ncbi:MAG: TIGR00730 family Rossman fold protein [Chitinophagaceae bacterium]|nr:TIGR00730 family Rossman fold protein [Oligoflexus sp.]
MNQSDSLRSPGLAYKNLDFLESDGGRTLRILSEYLEPYERLRKENIHETVVFFGSARISSTGPLQSYYDDARRLASMITTWALGLDGPRRFVICTGGGGGIMEAANKGAAEAGGVSIGLNIGLPHEQRPNEFVTPELLFEFHYFFMRKLWFSHLARALVVFPGGFGTLDELMDTLTLAQTGKLGRKVIIILYGSRYWNEIINFEALAQHGFIDPEDLNLFTIVDDVDSAFNILQNNLPLSVQEDSPAIAKSISKS